MESLPENLESLLRSLVSDALKEEENSKRVQHSGGQIMRLLLDAKRTEQERKRASQHLTSDNNAADFYFEMNRGSRSL